MGYSAGRWMLFSVVLVLAGCAEQDILDMNLREHKNIELHIHPILEIEILGERMIIPANIGISDKGMRVIHTHKEDGILHVESPEPHEFVLKDFFTIWGETFNETCILDTCVDEDHELNVFVNDIKDGRHGNIPLRDNDKIRIMYAKKD